MEPITSLMVRCALMEEGRTEFEMGASLQSKLRASLIEIYDTYTFLLAAALDPEHWTSDRKNPGYIVRTIDGIEVRVPWNLAPSFPQRLEVLQELVSFANKIRSGADSTICISGSSAFYESVHPIGDIDFCEYVALPEVNNEEDRSFARTATRALSLTDRSIVCTGIKVISPAKGTPHDRPWERSPLEDEHFLLQAQKALAGKCDFIGQSQVEGVVEITNLVLFLEPENPEGGSGQLSFSLQESPVGSWVPRQLSEPIQVGRYINWLRGEVTRLVQRGASPFLSKVSKRALALARVLFLGDLANQIEDFMHEQNLLLRAALLSRLALRKKIREMSGDSLVAAFEAPLDETIREFGGRLANGELDIPGADTMEEWCEKAESFLLDSFEENGESLRRELRSLLDEMTGLF